MPPSPPPAALLEAAQRADPARPLLTWYQPATGARVELSVVTFATWVAKTSALLCEELDLEPGGVVRVDLPAHWLGPVWAQSVWTLGGRLDLDGSGAEPVAVVKDAAQADPAGSTVPAPLVVVATRPLGGAAGPLTPPGALDYGREVPGMPDRFTPPVPAGPDVLPLDVLAAAQQRAAQRGPGARVLVVADRLDLDVTLDALLVPLLTAGSAVLVQGADVAPDVLDDIARAERVSATTPRW